MVNVFCLVAQKKKNVAHNHIIANSFGFTCICVKSPIPHLTIANYTLSILFITADWSAIENLTAELIFRITVPSAQSGGKEKRH